MAALEEPKAEIVQHDLRGSGDFLVTHRGMATTGMHKKNPKKRGICLYTVMPHYPVQLQSYVGDQHVVSS